MNKSEEIIPTKEQISFIAEIKERVRLAQYEAMKAINTSLINLYWDIGKSLSERQIESWGKSIVPKLSEELQKEFPGTGGFSTTNIWLMMQFYNEYSSSEILHPLVGEIGWSKNVVIMNKCNDSQERRFYTLMTKKYGWTKSVLLHQIENKSYEKYLLNQTNFDKLLPPELKNQAILAIKDDYNFELLDLADERRKKLEEKKMGMELKSIHDIFKDKILRIPSFQRGYSWSNKKEKNPDDPNKTGTTKGQLVDLWNDILNIPENKWHYTGLLTLAEVQDQDKKYKFLENYKEYQIVDGQQRITSILIIISILHESAKELKITLESNQYLFFQLGDTRIYIFGYDERNPSDNYFRIHILGSDVAVDVNRTDSVYTENLKNAKEYFGDKIKQLLKNLDDTEKEGKLKELFTKITTKLKMNVYILPVDLNQFVVFETMNNRGKPLSELEKLKNRLMYLSDKFEFNNTFNFTSNELLDIHIKNELENVINKSFTSIYQSLGAPKNSPLDDEIFLKNHWIFFFDRYNRNEANVYSDYLFNQYFTIENLNTKKLIPKDIIEYVKSLQNCSVEWLRINSPSYGNYDDNPNLKEAVLSLHRVGFRASFKPLVLVMFLKKNDVDTIRICKLLEEYAFKVFHIADRQSNTGDTKLYRLASKLFKSNFNTLEYALTEIKTHIDSYYNFDLFEAQIQDLFNNNNQKGYYEWSGIKYFLFIYDCFLREDNKSTTIASKLSWDDDFNTKNSIEHIYPQSAALSYEEYSDKNDSPQKSENYKEIQNNWKSFSGYEHEEQKRLCNSLGNLLAISCNDNSSFSNDPFDFKVDQTKKGEEYKNRGYKFNSMSAQIVSKNPDWTPDDVKDRGISMLDFLIENILQLKKDSIPEEKKLKLLGLEFMCKKEILLQKDNPI